MKTHERQPGIDVFHSMWTSKHLLKMHRPWEQIVVLRPCWAQVAMGTASWRSDSLYCEQG